MFSLSLRLKDRNLVNYVFHGSSCGHELCKSRGDAVVDRSLLRFQNFSSVLVWLIRVLSVNLNLLTVFVSDFLNYVSIHGQFTVETNYA